MPDNLSTDPYKGVRDFYPQDMAILDYIFSVCKKTCESFGYEQYNASLLEPTALYAAKSGEEIVNEQTYTFTDRGGREVTLRPEMTPTVARMVAAKRRELAFPLRWYSIPNIFRYENPQRGRLREHWQLNVDLFGGEAAAADIEIISLAHRLLKSFGAKESDFEIRINDRSAKLAGISEKNISAEQKHQLLKLLDKKEKMPASEFAEKTKEILAEAVELKFEESAQTKKVIDALKKRGMHNVRFSDSLVRGFDYYTGIVFEVYDTDAKNSRSLFGGGRFDNLLELFGEEKVSAVGFGAGDVTLRDFLETHTLLPSALWPGYKSSAHIQICTVTNEQNEEAVRAQADSLASQLRMHGINTIVDISGKKLGDQIKSADKRGIPSIIVIGENEAKAITAGGRIKIKNLATGEEKEHASAEAIADFLKK